MRIGFYIRSMLLILLTSKVSMMLVGQRWTTLGTLTQRLACLFLLLAAKIRVTTAQRFSLEPGRWTLFEAKQSQKLKM